MIEYITYKNNKIIKCSRCDKKVNICGMDKNKNKFCYDCISEKTVKAMDKTGETILYLTSSKKSITDFSGQLRFKIRGKKSIYKNGIKFVFRDENKNWWVGFSRTLCTYIIKCQRVEGKKPIL